MTGASPITFGVDLAKGPDVTVGVAVFPIGNLDVVVTLDASGPWMGFYPSGMAVPRDWPRALAMNACGPGTAAQLRAAADWVEGGRV